MEIDKVYLGDCLELMKEIPDKSIDCVLTDIPYNECNRIDNGLRNLDKSKADIGNFDLKELTSLLCDKTKGSIYMFCGINQISEIRKTMTSKGLSTRVVVWEKTNPSPMNGDVIWLSGIELCVFGKKKAQHSTTIAGTQYYDILVVQGRYIRLKSLLICSEN